MALKQCCVCLLRKLIDLSSWDVLAVPGLGCGTWDHFFSCKCRLLVAACGILAPWPGIEPRPLQWKRWILVTGLPGNSLACVLIVEELYLFFHLVFPLVPKYCMSQIKLCIVFLHMASIPTFLFRQFSYQSSRPKPLSPCLTFHPLCIKSWCSFLQNDSYLPLFPPFLYCTTLSHIWIMAMGFLASLPCNHPKICP